MSLTNLTTYTDSNAPGNEFSSLWHTSFIGSLRQPLLQGAGVNFNQIAGSTGMPGITNGIVVANQYRHFSGRL